MWTSLWFHTAIAYILLKNCSLSFLQTRKLSFRYLSLKPVVPVPSDIIISRQQTPKHIQQLAQEVGLLEHEVHVHVHLYMFVTQLHV